jgi:hypothetical protein
MDFDDRTALQLGFARQAGIEHAEQKYVNNMPQLFKETHQAEIEKISRDYERQLADEAQMSRAEYNTLKAKNIEGIYDYVNEASTASPWGVMDEKTGAMKLFANYPAMIRELKRDATEEELVHRFLTEKDQERYKNSKYILEQKPELLRNSFQAKYRALDARDKLTYRLPSHNKTIEGITIGDRDKGTLKALFKLRQEDYKPAAEEIVEDYKYDASELEPITPEKFMRFFGEPQSNFIKRQMQFLFYLSLWVPM